MDSTFALMTPPVAHNDTNAPFKAPDTRYFKNKEDFDKAVARDFIKYANKAADKGEKFIVGLSHGQSPSGAYQYIIDHYSELKSPENIHYTFVNSKLHSQRNLVGVTDATNFIRKLFRLLPPQSLRPGTLRIG